MTSSQCLQKKTFRRAICETKWLHVHLHHPGERLVLVELRFPPNSGWDTRHIEQQLIWMESRINLYEFWQGKLHDVLQAALEMSGDAVPQLLVPALLKLECKKKYNKRDVSSISQKKSQFLENVRLFPGTDCLACRTRLCSLLLPLSRSCSTNPRSTRSRHLWGKN